MILNNNFATIQSSLAKASAIKILGNSVRQNLAINIYNNSIANIATSNNTSSYVAAFEVDNCSGVNIYHNTVILSARDAQIYTSIFLNQVTNSCTINSQNNLFMNNVAAGTGRYSTFIVTPTVTSTSIFGTLNNNMYACPSSFAIGYGGTSTTTWAQWQGSTGKDVNSTRILYSGFYKDPVNEDYHIDGEVVGKEGMVVPIITGIPEIVSDIDGLQRGLEVNYLNQTTPGADEAMMILRNIDTAANLPARILQCEDLQEPIIVAVDKRFQNWSDNISREFYPEPINIWMNAAGDTLSLDNGGYNTDYYPFFFIELPNYTQSVRFRVITKVGYYESTSDWCDLEIIKLPEFTEQPEDKTLCINAGSVEVTSTVYGSYESLQWQKLESGTWTNVPNATSSNLTLTFQESQASANAAAGTYRLKVAPFQGLCDAEPVYYSQEIKVTIGFPLTNVLFDASMDAAELAEGICTGQELWFSATIPEGAGTVTGYRWERWDSIIGDFMPISALVNTSAATDTFRIYVTRLEDRGEYRCTVLGIEECSVGSTITTSSLKVNVNQASAFVVQPLPLEVCIGTKLVEELSSAITQPSDTTIAFVPNQYRWFKDGVELIRFNDDGFPISPADLLYDSLRTDTTYLPFRSVAFADEGKYSLRMIYLNCQGQMDTTFSDTVDLLVYGTPVVLHQSPNQYAMNGGYMALSVDVSTTASQNTAPLRYQWYRRYDANTVVKLIDDYHFHGALTPNLIVNPVKTSDINNQIFDEETGQALDYYFCVVTGLCGDSAISSPITVLLVPEINIPVPPSSATICEDSVQVFTVDAKPSDITQAIKYQWYKDGDPLNDNSRISGATDNILTITNALPSDEGDYYVLVSYVDLPASIQSSYAHLTIIKAPSIASITTDTTVVEGTMLILEVKTSESGNYDYQWYQDGMPLPGSNSEVYYVANASADEAGTYFVTITSNDGCGDVTSANIVVNITTTGIEDGIDPSFRIVSVIPNPILVGDISSATINFVLPEAQEANLSLIDISGKHVAQIYTGVGSEGMNSVSFTNNLNSISNGTYFIILESKGRKTATRISITK
jgi:hypothetical protein